MINKSIYKKMIALKTTFMPFKGVLLSFITLYKERWSQIAERLSIAKFIVFADNIGLIEY